MKILASIEIIFLPGIAGFLYLVGCGYLPGFFCKGEEVSQEFVGFNLSIPMFKGCGLPHGGV